MSEIQLDYLSCLSVKGQLTAERVEVKLSTFFDIQVLMSDWQDFMSEKHELPFCEGTFNSTSVIIRIPEVHKCYMVKTVIPIEFKE